MPNIVKCISITFSDGISRADGRRATWCETDTVGGGEVLGFSICQQTLFEHVRWHCFVNIYCGRQACLILCDKMRNLIIGQCALQDFDMSMSLVVRGIQLTITASAMSSLAKCKTSLSLIANDMIEMSFSNRIMHALRPWHWPLGADCDTGDHTDQVSDVSH